MKFTKVLISVQRRICNLKGGRNQIQSHREFTKIVNIETNKSFEIENDNEKSQ